MVAWPKLRLKTVGFGLMVERISHAAIRRRSPHKEASIRLMERLLSVTTSESMYRTPFKVIITTANNAPAPMSN